MATLIGLPKLSPTMEEGVLAKWHRKEGDKISPGDIIAEVETDKANMDFPLEDEGTLLKLLVKEGDTVKLGAPVAILGEPGEDFSSLLKGASAPAPAAPVAVAPAAPAPVAAANPPPTPPVAKAMAQQTGGKILASPIARALAAENGIDLRTLKGSGPDGRIVERDVKAAMGNGGAAKPADANAGANANGGAVRVARPVEVPSGEDFTDTPVSMMRKTIAKRLVESKTTAPHFYLTVECDAGPLGAFRAALNEIAGEDKERKISVNDLIVKACALALRRVPAANASWLGDRIRRHNRVHIGVAVSIEDGLLTPVVRDVDHKGLQTIHAEIRELAGRAKQKKLQPDEMTGGTFTVSNLGMYGIDEFAAVINPPEGAILAVGRARKVPVVVGDKIEVGERMSLTLSCDHRVVDGALGAQLLAELVKILERPAALAL